MGSERSSHYPLGLSRDVWKREFLQSVTERAAPGPAIGKHPRDLPILHVGGGQIGRPSTSTARCRFRPLIFLPASDPEGPPLSVVFTDGLSMIAPVGARRRNSSEPWKTADDRAASGTTGTPTTAGTGAHRQVRRGPVARGRPGLGISGPPAASVRSSCGRPYCGRVASLHAMVSSFVGLQSPDRGPQREATRDFRNRY